MSKPSQAINAVRTTNARIVKSAHDKSKRLATPASQQPPTDADKLIGHEDPALVPSDATPVATAEQATTSSKETAPSVDSTTHLAASTTSPQLELFSLAATNSIDPIDTSSTQATSATAAQTGAVADTGVLANPLPSWLPSNLPAGWSSGLMVAGGVVAAGALGGGSSTPPTLAINSDKAVVLNGQTAIVSFTFNKPVQGFDLTDVSVNHGTLSNLQSNASGTVFTATYTPPANTTHTDVQFSVQGSSFTDAAGAPQTGTFTAQTVVDTHAPTLAITSDDSTLSIGQTATLTFTFSEAVQGFDLSDISLSSGALTNLQSNASGSVYTATYTPYELTTANESISVLSTTYTDSAGNTGTADATLSMVVDTAAPVLRSISANAAANTITLNFDSAIDAAHLPTASDFTVLQGGRSLVISSIAVQTQTNLLTITLDSANGDLQSGAFSLAYAGHTIQDLRGNLSANFMQGIVADGYIAGASIFIDANNNGVADSGEFTGVVTGKDGSFVLPNMTSSGAILALGGVNTDTGLANTMTLSAPSGSLLLNPLTTLVQQVARSTGLDTDTAAIQVRTALGLSSTIDLNSYDPLSADGADLNALAVQKAAAQIAALVNLASEHANNQDTMLQGLASAIHSASGTAIDVSNTSLISSLLTQAGFSASDAATVAVAVVSAMNQIDGAVSLSDITEVQRATSPDFVAPAAPDIKAALSSAMGEVPSVLIALQTGKLDGTDAMVGNTLTVTLADARTLTHVLSADDIAAGHVRLDLPAGADLTAELRATLTDRSGLVSDVAHYNQPDSDTIDMAAVFAPNLIMMLQEFNNIELPIVGPMTDITKAIQEVFMNMMADMPSIQLISTYAAPASGAVALSAATTDDSGIDFSFVTPTADDTVPTDPVAPAPDPLAPTTTDPVTPTPPPVPVVQMTGRATGAQFTLPTKFPDFWPNAFTLNSKSGDFKFSYSFDVPIINLPMLGNMGIEGAQARIDANLGGYFTTTINLEGKLDAKKYARIDTEKSKLELFFNAGLSEGSMVAAQLGPLIMSGTNINSKRVETDQQRSSTGIEGTVTAFLLDNDGTKDKTLEMTTNTIAKFFNEIGNNTFKLSDWYGLKVDLAGQLSAQLTAQADLNLPLESINTTALATSLGLPQSVISVTGEVDKFIQSVDSLLGIFSPQISTKLTAPVSLQWDSSKPDTTKAQYAKVYFDDIQLGVGTVLSKTMGPGLDMLDSVMSPLYLIENFMNSPRGTWPTQLATPLQAPNWIPGFLTEDIMAVVNAPGNLLNTEWNKLQTVFDRNQDNRVSVFESLRGTVDVYNQVAVDIQYVWDKFKLIPGAETALNTSLNTLVAGSGSVVTAIIESIVASVARPAAATVDNPDRLSPMQMVQQGLDAAEKVFRAIDQLEGLRVEYDNAMADIARLDQSSGTELKYSLGSYVWDVTNNSVTSVRNAYAEKPVDFKSSAGFDRFADITRDEAIALIYQQVKARTASPETLSPTVFAKAGVVYSYASDSFTGVDDYNIKAICDFLNNKQLDTKNPAIESDWSSESFIQEHAALFPKELEEVGLYHALTKLAEGSMSFVPKHTEQVYRDVWVGSDWRTYTGSDVASMLYNLGVIPSSDRKMVTESSWDPWYGKEEMPGSEYFDYKYGGKAADYILREMIKAQNVKDLDEVSELKELWRVEIKWENLMANQTTNPYIRGWSIDNPDDEDLNQYFLTFAEFKRAGLEILSQDESVRKTANEKIRDWSWDGTWSSPEKFSQVYLEVSQYISDDNSRFLNNISDAIYVEIQKLMKLANQDSIGNSDITISDFTTLGINNMSVDWVPLFRDLLVTSRIQAQDVNSMDKVIKLVNAIETLAKVVNDQTVDANNFYTAMEIVLGSDKAKLLEFIPRANTGSMDNTTNTQTLTLLQSILKAQDWSGVDSSSELDKLVAVTEDIEKTSMSSDKVWVTTDSSFNGRSETEDKKYGSGYKSSLTVGDLTLLGFKNISTPTRDELVNALKAYNETGRKQSYYNGEYYDYIAELNSTPLDYQVLAKLVQDYSQLGFFQELLSKSPALSKFWNSMIEMGFDVPFLSDPALLQKIWMGEPIDLLTFNPNLKDLTVNLKTTLFDLDILKLLGVSTDLISVPLKANFEASITPRLSFGIDTGGLIEATQLASYDPVKNIMDFGGNTLEAVRALLNGIYINDQYNVNGTMVDLPELETSLNFNALIGAQIGKVDQVFSAFANLTTGFNFNANLDLANPGPDGKVRLSNLIGELFSQPLDVLNLESSLSWFLKATADMKINSEPTNGFGDISDANKLLIQAAAVIFGAKTMELGPYSVGVNQVLLDDNPYTDAPSLLDLWNSLMQSTTQPVITA